MVYGEYTLCDELPIDRLPLLFIEFLADAESAEFTMAPLQHARRFVAEQHVDQVACAESLATAKNTRERFLRDDRAIPYFRRLETDIAVAAFHRCFAEVAEKPDTPTGGCLA